MATFFGLSEALEQELIDALYHYYVSDGDQPTRKDLRDRLESLIERLDECSVYEDEIIRATGSSQPYTCNAYPAELVDQTAHQVGVGLLRLVLQAIRENVRGELTPMMWVDRETGEPLRESAVWREINSKGGEPVRPNFVLKPVRVDQVKVDRLILAIRRERKLMRSSARLAEDHAHTGAPGVPSYLDLHIDRNQRTVRRKGYDTITVVRLTNLEWQAFLLLFEAAGKIVPADGFVEPRYSGSSNSALRNVINGLDEKLRPLDVGIVDWALKDCRKT